jgi:hypothetical protein
VASASAYMSALNRAVAAAPEAVGNKQRPVLAEVTV